MYIGTFHPKTANVFNAQDSNWQMISDLNHMLFFLPLDWISVTFFFEPEEKECPIFYLCGNINSSLIGISVPQTYIWTKIICLYVSIKQIVGWHERGCNKCSEWSWGLTDTVLHSVPITVQLIGDGEWTSVTYWRQLNALTAPHTFFCMVLSSVIKWLLSPILFIYL